MDSMESNMEKGKNESVENPLNGYPISRSKTEKEEFLLQLELVTEETHGLMIEKARNIKLLNKVRTESLVAEMLTMKPRFCLKNGKVKPIRHTRAIPQKKKAKPPKKLAKNVRRQRAWSPGVFYSRRRNELPLLFTPRCHLSRTGVTGSGLSESSNQLLTMCKRFSVRGDIRISEETPLCDRYREVDTGKGLSKRSNKLVQLCKDLSIRVIRMSDEDIAKKMWETENAGNQSSIHTEEIERSSHFLLGQTDEFSTALAKDGHRHSTFSVDVYNLSKEDIQREINRLKNRIQQDVCDSGIPVL